MPKVSWDQKDYGQGRSGDAFELLPRGKYVAEIEDIEERPTKAKTGHFYNVTFTVTKGQYKNRKLWMILNYDNPNEVAERIGREQFNALCAVAGFEDGVKTTEKLHGKVVGLHVGIERDETYGDKNRVNGFVPADEVAVDEEVEDRPARAAAPASRNGAPMKSAGGKRKDDFDDDIPF
jgi:hypothetical protein